MLDILTNYADFFIKLFLAILLGSLVGLERVLAGKRAGMRTHALVSMGSCLFVMISDAISAEFKTLPGFNPTMMASQVIVGIGFVCAGLIIFKKDDIQGLTTAAGLWVTAALGMAIGFGLYALAFLAGFFILFIFSIMWKIEEKIMDRRWNNTVTQGEESQYDIDYSGRPE